MEEIKSEEGENVWLPDSDIFSFFQMTISEKEILEETL